MSFAGNPNVSMPRPGDIASAKITDERDRNLKDRPVIVISISSDGERAVVAAITTVTPVMPNPLPEVYVPLPCHRNRHPKTGLNKKSAAKCDWLKKVPVRDISRVVGPVPEQEWLRILDQINKHGGR